jgi:hypothetical protein
MLKNYILMFAGLVFCFSFYAFVHYYFKYIKSFDSLSIHALFYLKQKRLNFKIAMGMLIIILLTINLA